MQILEVSPQAPCLHIQPFSGRRELPLNPSRLEGYIDYTDIGGITPGSMTTH